MTRKKLIAMVLTLCIIVSVLPVNVLAASASVTIANETVSVDDAKAAYFTTDSEGQLTAGGDESTYNIKVSAAVSGEKSKGIVTLRNAVIDGNIELNSQQDYKIELIGNNVLNGSLLCNYSQYELLIEGSSKEDALIMCSDNEMDSYMINMMYYTLSLKNCTISADCIDNANVGLPDVLSLHGVDLNVLNLQWMPDGGIFLKDSTLSVGKKGDEEGYYSFWAERITMFENSTIYAHTPLFNYAHFTEGLDLLKPYLDEVYTLGIPENMAEPFSVLEDGVPSPFFVTSVVREVEITGVEAKNAVYDGTPKPGYTGEPTSDYKGEYVISYSGTDYSGNVHEAADKMPTNAGTYQVTFKVPEGHLRFKGSKTLDFIIEKAEPSLSLIPSEAQLNGGRTVVLTAKGVPNGVKAFVSCDNLNIADNHDGTYTVELEDADKTYLFVLETEETNNYKAADASCEVQVTRSEASNPTPDPDPVPLYVVTFDSKGGSEIDPAKVVENGTVAEPEAPTKGGYDFIGWYKDEDYQTPYDFSQAVTEHFTLYAKWEQKPYSGDCPQDHTCPIYPYKDSDPKAWYHNGVHYCIENRYMIGYADANFHPSDYTTRGMLVTILYRAENSPKVDRNTTFLDLDPEAFYMDAVIWAQKEGVVTGYNDTTFGPLDPITREQIAAILYRYAAYKGYDVSSIAESGDILSFEDAADVSEWALTAMKYAVGAGLIKGRDGIKLAPREFTERAEMATLVQRFLEENR